MAEAIVGLLLEDLEKLIKRELKLLWNAKSEMKKLSSTLTAIQAVLADAETQQITKKAVEDWLAKLKDVAYDADDILDEWATDESLFQQPSNNDNKVLASCFSSLKNYAKLTKSHYKIAKKIKNITERIEAIAKEKSGLHLSEGGAVDAPSTQNRETSSVPKEPQIYGRDADVENIVKSLLECLSNEDGGVSVLPILGIGGLGKTTLAQLLYNDERVGKHFESRIWYCVSDDFDVKKISNAIVKSVTGCGCEPDDTLDHLQVRLRETLEGRRFLLVLDDVWSEKQDEWTKFKNSLTSGAKGSSVILTTRLPTVASIAGTAAAYELSLLSKDDCLMLFLFYAFGNELDQENPNLVEIGRQIVEKCRGVPLAARALGSLLRFTRDERQWEHIRDNEIWNLQEGKEETILPALRLSYTYLSSHARQCFAYCSLFPKDYVMEKENLIYIWMANGLIPIDERTDPEVAGDEVFNELLWHSMLQGTKRDEDGNVVRCRIHDLLHDLASSVLKKDLLHIKHGDEREVNISDKVRHLSVSGSSSELHINHPSKSQLSLRTLMFIGGFDGGYPNDFTRITRLRTLHLTGVELSTLPPSIGDLKHLRYLNLESFGLASEIPESICKLRNLQMLNLAKNNLLALPSSIGDLKNLRYLNLSYNRRITSLPEYIGGLKSLQRLEVAQCYKLETLPSSIGDLEKLRYLNLSNNERITILPESIGGLKSLQALKAVWCDKLEAWPSSIGDLKNLRYLNLSHNKRITSLPDSIGGLESLQTLEATNCDKLEALPSSIGELKNLRYLDLSYNRRITLLPEFIGGLKSLQTLKAVWCNKLKALPESTSSLRSLKHLDTSYCHGLEGMPNGIGSLTGLQTLSYFKIGRKEKGFDGIRELRGLNLLRGKLWIVGLDNVKSLENARGACLMSKTKLSKLKLDWLFSGVNSHSREVLEGLQPHPNIEELTISNYPGVEFPSWMQMMDPPSSFPRLVKLELVNLDNLEEWSLNWKENECLPALQSLELFSCNRLKSLPVQICNLTSLKSLGITVCRKLASLPHELSLRLTSLETLRISYCPSLRSFPKLGIEGQKSCLRSLDVADCKELASRLEGLQHLTVLESLEFKNCPKLKFSMQDLEHLITLKTLTIDSPIELPESVKARVCLKLNKPRSGVGV